MQSPSSTPLGKARQLGPYGAIVVSFWAVAWFEAGIVRPLGYRSPLLALPLLISAAIVVWAVQVIRQPGTVYRMDRHSRKITLQATLGEAIGIALVVNVLLNTGFADDVLPGVALVVGLHFIYMACCIPRRRFYGIAAILLLGSASGLALGPQKGDTLIGVGAAVTFWASAVRAVRLSADSGIRRVG